MRQGLRGSDWVSLSRIPLALLFVALFRAQPGQLLVASILAAAAAQLSDHLDGFLARRSTGSTVKGWLFDSVADRAFYVGALLAFDREFGLNDVLVWAFIMREIALYAFRVATGEFEVARPGFRILALCHAGLVRIGIVFGCIIPFGIMPNWIQSSAHLLLTTQLATATCLGYFCLILLARPAR